MVKILKEGFKSLAEATRKAENRAHGMKVPDDDVTKTESGTLIIKAMPNEDLQLLNESLAKNAGISKGLDLGRIGEIFGKGEGLVKIDGDRLMLNDFDIQKVLLNIKKNNKEVFDYLKRDTKSMDDLMKLANATGYEGIIYKMLGRKAGDVAPAEDTLAGIVAMIKFGKEIEALAKTGAKATDIAAKEEAFKKMRLLATIQSNLAAQVSGNVSEYGRGLAVVRHLSMVDIDAKDYAEQLNKFVTEMDDGLIDYHFHQMLTLQSQTAKARYAEKGLLAKTFDFAMEQYVNALLSSPVTHMVNVASNAMFQVQTLAERGLAGVIGNVRTLGGRLGEAGDQRYIGEAAAEAHGLAMAQKDALLLMGKVMVTGETSDVTSKIDLRARRSFGSTDNILEIAENINNGDFTKSAIDLMGIATRLPGRFLATEDEYFKIITQRRVLYREAFRAGEIAYTNARRSGMSRADAKAQGSKAYTDTMLQPPDGVVKKMKDEAKHMTFQNAPEGFLGGLAQTIHSIPVLRVVVPFVNTPTNIIQGAFDRTLNFSPIYRYIKQNAPGGKTLIGGNKPITGPEFDDALAKLALGNSIAAGMYFLASGEYGDDLIVTGRLGKNFSTRMGVSSSANVPPYSIGIRQEDGSYKFTSFSRFDPLSAMLAMGADMAEYAQYEDDPSMVAMMSKAYTLAAAEYASNMPFLQGVAEMTKMATGQGSTEDFGNRAAAWVGAQAGNVGTNVLGNLDRASFGLMSYAANELSDGKYPMVSQNSFQATMERLNDPKASNTMLPPGLAPTFMGGDYYTESSMIVQGFYAALQKAKARNPYFSADLPVGLNWWGEQKYQGEGKFREAISPIRIQTGKYSVLDQEIIRLSETGIGVLTGKHPDRIDGIKLNNRQYNRFVQLINQVDGGKNGGKLPGDFGYNEDDNLINMLQRTVLSDTVLGFDYNELNEDQKFDELSNILSERRANARIQLKKEFPNLDARIELSQ